MHVLNIVTSPRKDQSASRALVDAFLREYMKHADDIVVDTLDVWQEWLPEFDAETINAKYKGVSGEPMTPAEVTAWEKIGELASRFQSADRIAMGVPREPEPLRAVLMRTKAIQSVRQAAPRANKSGKATKSRVDRVGRGMGAWKRTLAVPCNCCHFACSRFERDFAACSGLEKGQYLSLARKFHW